ncbi:MAG: ribonuclease R, partial [Selenomonas artemidis]
MEQEQLDIVKERIRAFMREDAYRPLKEDELAAGLRGVGEDVPGFAEALAALETDGAVIRNRSGLYGVPSRMNLVVGRLSMSPKGFGFIIPDVRDTEEETDVFVPGSALATAMHGDRVVARVTPSEQPGRAREGEIIRILERVNTRIVGTFERSKAFG